MKLRVDNGCYSFQYSDMRRILEEKNYKFPITPWLNEITIYER